MTSAPIGSVLLDTVSFQENKVSALCYVTLGLPSVCTHGSQMFPSHVNAAMEANQVAVGDLSASPLSEIRLWTLSRVVFFYFFATHGVPCWQRADGKKRSGLEGLPCFGDFVYDTKSWTGSSC